MVFGGLRVVVPERGRVGVAGLPASSRFPGLRVGRDSVFSRGRCQQPQRQRPGEPNQTIIITDEFQPVGP